MKKHISETTLYGEQDLRKAGQFVEGVCDLYHAGPEYFANIMLATDEAIKYVMKKSLEAGGEISLTAEQKSGGLRFIIDGRKGNRPAPVDELEIEIEKNRITRELYIIYSLSDKCNFSKQGTRIELCFNITSLDNEKYLGRVHQLIGYFSSKPVLKRENDA